MRATLCILRRSVFPVGFVFAMYGLVWALPGPAARHDLSFDERVDAELAVERVYASHVEGASMEGADARAEAPARGALERKVRAYLAQSAALDSYWRTSVGPEDLRNELNRIARDTRFPDRLEEIYAALGRDAFKIQECFARPALVDRWARSLFAFDPRIHAEQRAVADAIRADLASGARDPRSDEPHRRLIELRLRSEGAHPVEDGVELPAEGAGGPVRLRVGPAAFKAWRHLTPEHPGDAGPVVEERDAFVVRVLISEGPDQALIACYRIPKRTWDDWWGEMEAGFAAREVKAVASPAVPLPEPSTPAASASWLPNMASSTFAAPVGNGGSTCSPTNSWDNGVLDAVPEGRSGATAVWTGRLMIVWGGEKDGRSVQTGGRYDPLTDTWSPTSLTNAPTARALHTAVWTGKVMVVWGGLTADGASGGRYDPVLDTWTPTSQTQAAAARRDHTAVWTGRVMVVWGGTTSDLSGTHFVDTGGRYDPVTDSWQPTSTVGAASGRANHTAIWTGRQMVVWGGLWSDGTNHVTLNTGGLYNPVSDTWLPISMTDAPMGRMYHTAVWTGSQMIVWGGQNFPAPNQLVYLQSGGRYQPDSDTWAPTTMTNAPAARRDHTADWSDHGMLVWGGSGASGSPYATGARYDPTTNMWTPMTGIGAPEGRAGHVSVWTGSRLILWGGSVTGGVSPDSGAQYDPVRDQYQPTFSQNAPEPRESATAVWTGNQLIVWGGLRSEEPVSTGGRYDPLIDAWKLTATAGVQKARVHHTAVWTGTRMIIWGGEPCPNIYDRGQAYDPVMDVWTSIDYTTEPVPRRHHTAVWTGKRMIVWGGLSCAYPPDVLQTGARYDPEVNRWTPTSTASAPTARQYHTSIWTGSRMIVWGGSDNGSPPAFFDTGALYDPFLDSWVALARGHAPKPRIRHTAVWTGSQMIVWGGTGTADLDSGGRYDIATGHWSGVSGNGAPSPRLGHTAVWAGNAMVVWGGETSEYGFDEMNTGGLYDPVANNWTPTTTSKAPSARKDHVAAWTGTFMIVWGGSGVFWPASGGRFVVNNPDGDNDGVADVCDCAPADPGVFSVPREITGLDFDPDKITLHWDSALPTGGVSTTHDALKGMVGNLPVGGPGESCLPGGSQASRQDISVPASSSAFFYLARGRNSCGTGTYGYATDGTERMSSACP